MIYARQPPPPTPARGAKERTVAIARDVTIRASRLLLRRRRERNSFVAIDKSSRYLLSDVHVRMHTLGGHTPTYSSYRAEQSGYSFAASYFSLLSR